MSATKNLKMGLSKANLNAIINAIGTAALYKIISGSVTVGGETTNFSAKIAAINAAIASVGDTYVSGTEYPKGKVVIKDGGLVRAKQAIASGESWTASHWESITLQDEVQEAVDAVNGKIDFGGYVYDPTLGSGSADVADNLITNKGATVTDALANWDLISKAIKDGSYAKVDGFEGNSVVANNHAPSLNGATWHTTGMASASVSSDNKKITITTDGTGNECYILFVYDTPLGTKNILQFNITNATSTTDKLFLRWPAYTASVTIENKTYQWIFEPSTVVGENTYLGIRFENNEQVTLTLEIEFYTNLTQFFGSNVLKSQGGPFPDDLLSDPSLFTKKYWKGSLAYDAGSMVNSQPEKIVSHGFNLWDEVVELGNIKRDTGAKTSDSSMLRSKNFTRVKPNTQYYFYEGFSPAYHNIYFYDANHNYLSTNTSDATTFTTPDNCFYIMFALHSTYGTTYRNDICINRSNASLNGKYKPYRAPLEYPLVMPIMRSAGDARDDVQKAKVESVDLGTLDWTGGSSVGVPYFYATVPEAVVGTSATDTGHLLCAKYAEDTAYNVVRSLSDKCIALNNSASGNILIRDTTYTDAAAFKAAMSGVILNYELATPTDQDPISLPENVEVEDGGSLETVYTDPNVAPALISVTYQADIKNFIEALGSRTPDIAWDASEIVSQSELSAGLAPKADIEKIENGDIKASIAKSLDTEVGNGDETPFSFATVGIDTDVETGFQELRKLVGVDVVDNQLFNGSFASASGWTASNGTLSASDNILSFTASAQDGGFYCNTSYDLIVGHSYLCLVEIKGTSATNSVRVRGFGGTEDKYPDITTSWQTLSYVAYVLTSGPYLFSFSDGRASDWDAIQVRSIKIIDLTQRYGSNDVVNAIIGNDSSKYVERLIAFDPKILKLSAHDAGSFPMVKAAKLETIDYNQWDEEWENGTFDTTTGANEESTSIIRSKNLIRVKGDTVYASKNTRVGTAVWAMFYDAQGNVIPLTSALGGVRSNNVMLLTENTTGKSPINAYSMKFYVYGEPTYNDDVCIFLYWDGSRIGYEHFQKHEIALPNEQLHGILKVVNGKVVADGDERYPDGTGKNRYGADALGSYDWTATAGANSQVGFVTYALSSVIKRPSSNGDVSEIRCVKYVADSANNLYLEHTTIGIAVQTDGSILVYDPACASMTAAEFKTAMSGVAFTYPLASETEVESTAYSESFYGDDFGTMRFLDENGNEIAGLPGNEIFYKANIAGFAESLYVKTDGKPNNLVVQSDLAGYVKQTDLSSGITDVAGLTYSVKKVCKTGNMVSLVIVATNNSGSDIATETNLFTLPSGCSPSTILRMTVIKNNDTFSVGYYNSGMYVTSSIPNGTLITITATFLV